MSQPTYEDEQMRLEAEKCMRDGRFADAVALYRTLVAAHPGEESYLLALAWACHDLGAWEEAIDCFERLLDRELSRKVFTGFGFDELVRIYKERGLHDRLVEVCRRACAAQPEDYALLGELGEACLLAAQPAEAAAAFRLMTEMEPDDAMAFCRLGNALIAAGDFAEAEAAYGRAAALEPDTGAVFSLRLADAYLKAGETERAETAARRCLASRPDEPLYHCTLGDILVRRGRLEEARGCYDAAVALRPEDAGAYYNRLGNALARDGRHREALEAFRAAVAAAPDTPALYERLAAACRALGLDEQAREAELRAGANKKGPRGNPTGR